MLLYRDMNAREMDADCVRYVLIDSSPQYGRDYQIVLTKRISKVSVERLWHNTTLVYGLWRNRPDGDALEDWLRDSDLWDAEVAAFEEIHAKIHWHVLPAVQIGFGASGLYMKLHAIFHAIRFNTSKI